MKRTPVSDLPIPVVANIAEYAAMFGIPFKLALDIYYGRDALSVMGYFSIECAIHSIDVSGMLP
jgi:hypothetical protein